MRVLIVDDERPARDKLRRLLAFESDIEAIDEACDGVEALARMAQCAPDAVFLDIQMPEMNGFDVAACLPVPQPLLVFVTAYDEHAVRAFDANAIDYLLKPYDQARLQRALQRVRARLAAAPPKHHLQHVLVNQRGVTRLVKVDDIEWLETADNYVVLHTAQGSPMLRQTLAGLLNRLGPAFQRSHRRAAVRLSGIEGFHADAKGDGAVLLRGGVRAPMSRQYHAGLIALLR
ncbi:LytR/AlgR family response regulator transcription factor [Massilia sp. S19_KUP03_FR1]|uniref:LytR/AlgR family response regulator transcription factor n=1 Tax=Massilia sp. S19_KUP03_FR1 TaxID=3025503 RepID=UPI002FCDA78B